MANNNLIDKLHPEYPYAIFCEGIDEVKFMAAYVTYLVANNKIANNRFYAYNCGGNDEIEYKLRLYKKQNNFKQLKGYIVIEFSQSEVENRKGLIKNSIPAQPPKR